ncbi:hypothetical protein G6F15_013194 [Rhizopus arrhizus]|nr:hypothetical protein G6F15_013194 [Rhizopus arrhizus]
MNQETFSPLFSGLSVPAGLYLKQIYEEHGPEGVEAHLNNYLNQCEDGGYQPIEYVIGSGIGTRQEFINYIMNQLALNKGQIEAHITATPYDPETGEDITQPDSILNLLDTDDLFDVIYNCVNQNPEPTEDPAIHEYFMIEVYDQYMQIMQEQENLRELKEQVIVRLLWHIEEWTRMTFSGINQRWGEEIYWETKYNQLRRLLPNLANHRVLVKRIRDEDPLLQVNSQTRDGLSSGGRICSTNDEILDQENNADHKNNFDVQRH